MRVILAPVMRSLCYHLSTDSPFSRSCQSKQFKPSYSVRQVESWVLLRVSICPRWRFQPWTTNHRLSRKNWALGRLIQLGQIIRQSATRLWVELTAIITLVHSDFSLHHTMKQCIYHKFILAKRRSVELNARGPQIISDATRQGSPD